MKKSLKGLVFLGAVASLCACAPTGGQCYDFTYEEDHGDLIFWSSFGGAYTTILEGIVQDIVFEYSQGQPKANEYGYSLNITHESQGSYDGIKTNTMSAIIKGDYPNVLVGYPDHFAEYSGNGIITPLDFYMEKYKEDTGIDLEEEYYSAYMVENRNVQVDCSGEPVTTGIPFNKSTELMGYNGVFVDYCVYWCSQNPNVEVNGVKASNWNLGAVPETWQDWAVKGLYYKHIMDTLTCVGSGKDKNGCLVYGKQNYEGTASDFEVVELGYNEVIQDASKGIDLTKKGDKDLLLDFHKAERSMTRVISWDSTDNMFITLLRQWGAEYTNLPESEKTKQTFYRNGHVLFNNAQNRAKTIECLKYFTQMNLNGIFGVPQTFGGSYSSSAFEENKVMFMLCSSGGLGYNTAKWTNRFRVAHLPYYKEGNVVRKYVISQGANLAMTDIGACDDAFKFMVELTTGQHQLDWCLKTGYYPASASVAQSKEYQNFLNEDTIAAQAGNAASAYQDKNGNPSGTKVAYREGSKVNEDYYMPTGSHFSDDGVDWVKFVDDAFIQSSDVRTEIKRIFNNAFSLTKEEAQSDSKYQKLLDDVCNTLQSKSNLVVER